MISGYLLREGEGGIGGEKVVVTGVFWGLMVGKIRFIYTGETELRGIGERSERSRLDDSLTRQGLQRWNASRLVVVIVH